MKLVVDVEPCTFLHTKRLFALQIQWQIQGGATAPPPLKIGSTVCFKSNSFITIIKNKAQIARESIKTTLALPGPLSGSWTPVESEFGSAVLIGVRAHNLLRPPPPPPNENPGSGPEILQWTLVKKSTDTCYHKSNFAGHKMQNCFVFFLQPWGNNILIYR